MMPSLFQPLARHLLAIPPRLLLLLIVWTLVWKGLALWRSARAGQAVWFVVILVVNTAGLLEIAYLAFIAPRRPPLVDAEPGAPGAPAGGA